MNREQSLGIRITDMIDAGEPPETLDDNALMDFYEARDGFTLLQQLEEVHVPIGFSRRLKSRVRRRSGGRLFNPVHQPFGPRISVESFVILAIAEIKKEKRIFLSILRQ